MQLLLIFDVVILMQNSRRIAIVAYLTLLNARGQFFYINLYFIINIVNSSGLILKYLI